MDCEARNLVLEVNKLGLSALFVDNDAVLIKLEAESLEVSDCSVNEVGADADVTVSAGALAVHELEALARKYRLGGLTHGHTEHKLEELCRLNSLVLGLAVDADVNELETEHNLYRVSGKGGNLVPLLVTDEVITNHEGAAASDNLIKLEVVKKVVGVDTAGGHKGKLTVGCSHSLKHLKTASRLCGEELYSLETELESRLDVRGVRATGKHGDTLGKSVSGNLGVKAGGYEELGACGDSGVNLLTGKDGARTDKHLGISVGNVLDCLCRTRGTEGNLRGGKSAVDKCLCKRYCILCILNLDNRDKTDGLEFVCHTHCFSPGNNFLSIILYNIPPARYIANIAIDIAYIALL